MAQIGKLHKPKNAQSKYSLTGMIYLLGIPISIGIKKTDKDYVVESVGLATFDNKSAKPVETIKPEEF